MLKTNGSVASREEYSIEVGSLVMIPARNYADRAPHGIAEYSIWYRFAGVHQPGIAIPKSIKVEDTEAKNRIKELEARNNAL